MTPEARVKRDDEDARKRAAGVKARHAMRVGRIPAPAVCESCGVDIRGCQQQAGLRTRPLGVMHHHDYAEPLDVIPLCRVCHKAIHHGMLPEPRTGRMYPVAAGGLTVEHRHLAEPLTAAVVELIRAGRRTRMQPTAALQALAVKLRIVVRSGPRAKSRYHQVVAIDAALARMRVPLAERAP